MSLLASALGSELGATGTTSALACALGATYLIWLGAASLRTMTGAVAGLFVAATLANLTGNEDPAANLQWYWHLVLGNFAFAVAFLATDPTTTPLTK